MDFPVWKTAYRFCGRLAETDECKECEEHFKSYGHPLSSSGGSPGRA